MSSGLRLRRPVFFCRRTPLSCLSSPHRSLPRLSSRLPSFSCRPASPSARFSLCPCFSQPASRQLCRFVLRRLYSVWFFFCHFLFFRSSSIARRLLSVARCLSLAAHCLSLAARCPSLAACCPSLVAPFIVHRPSFVVRRPLSIPCCPLPVTCRPLFIACCVARTPSPLSVPRRRAAPLSAAVRSGSRLLYPRNPGLRVCGNCLPCRSAAGSVGRSFRKNASALRTLVAAPFLTK